MDNTTTFEMLVKKLIGWEVAKIEERKNFV